MVLYKIVVALGILSSGVAGVALAQPSPVQPQPPAPLNTNSGSDTLRDRNVALASAPAGVSVAVWAASGATNGIFVARTSDSGGSWSAPVALSTGNQHGNPAVATDGLGVWVAVWNSRNQGAPSVGTDDDIWFARSTDNGQSWSAPAPLNTPYAVASTGVDIKPSVVALANGEWVVAWESTTVISGHPSLGAIGSDSDILVSRSEDSGVTWSYPNPLRPGYAFGTNGNDTDVRLASDGQGRLVAVWSSSDDLARFNEVNIGTDSDILVSRSASRGIGWTFPEPLNDYASFDSNSDTLPSIATDGTGAWIVVWQSAYPGQGSPSFGLDFDIWVSRSFKEGELWSPATPLVAEFAAQASRNRAPRIGTDALGNWVVVWDSNSSIAEPGDDDDILFSFSNDAGDSWLSPAPMNTNAATDGGALDTLPAITVDGSGVWIVAWQTTNPSFGAGPSEEDIAYTRFESPVVDVAWTGLSSSFFGVGGNWSPQRVPTVFDRAVFDQTAVGNLLPGVFVVTVDAGATLGRMALRTNDVTLAMFSDIHLVAGASDVAPAPLIVGELPGQNVARLTLSSSGQSPNDRLFSLEAASIATRIGSFGALDIRGAAGGANGRVNFFVTRGPTRVGDRGVGDLSVLAGGRATLTGDLRIGATPTGVGRVQVRQTGSRAEYGGTLTDPARLLVGDEGAGELIVGLANDPAPGPSLAQIQPVEEVVVGNRPGSIGRVRVAGAGSRWITTAARTVFGEEGHAEVSVSAGGAIESNSPGEIRLANLAGSSALLEVRGPGSMFSSASAVSIGLGGQAVATIGPGATLSSASVISVLPRGRLVGAGAVAGTLVNTGEVRVGVTQPGATEPDGFGVLQVQGAYRQLGPALSGQPQSGSLAIRLGGTARGATYDAVDVSDDAFLGGGLFISLSPEFAISGGPQVGDTFNIMQATQLDPNARTFDVALLPGFADDRLVRVNYLAGHVQLEVTTFGRAFGFDPPADGATLSGAPARAVVADLNRDGLPDLAVIATQGSDSFLFVFRNAGVHPGTGDWLGFESLLTIPVTSEGVPRAIGVGDFFPQNGFADDLVIAFDRPGEGRVRFYRNTGGSPAYLPDAFFSIAPDPVALAVDDITGDFRDDVVVVTGESATVERVFGLMNMMALQAPRTLTAPARPSSVDISDLDNDKDILLGGAQRDLVIGDAGAGAILILRNDGTGDFPNDPIAFGANGPVDQVLLADLNEDGLVDIVGLVPNEGTLAVIINRPDPGEFAPPVNLVIGANPRSVVIADLGGSDALDLAVITDADTPGMREVRTLRGEVLDGAVSYSPGPSFGVQPGATILLSADLDGSQSADLLTVGNTPQGASLGGDDQGRVEALLRAGKGVEPCPGDTNGDRVINFADLNAVLSLFGQAGPGLPGDVTGDGVVNFSDLNLVLTRFGDSCP